MASETQTPNHSKILEYLNKYYLNILSGFTDFLYNTLLQMGPRNPPQLYGWMRLGA